MSRRTVVLLLMVVVFCVTIVAFNSYRHSYQTITISNDSAFSLALYRAADTHESTAYKASDLVFKTSRAGSHKVKRGSYVYAVSGSADYQTLVKPVTVDTKPLVLSIPSPDYTASRLSVLLTTELPSINALLAEKYPSQMALYTLQAPRLYKDSQWFGGKLVPNDPSTYDTLRVILHKVNGSWQVISNPPEIVVSAPVYPDVPTDILTDLDNR